MNLKKIPLSVLKAIEPYRRVIENKFYYKQNEKSLLYFEEKDKTSSFFFNIKADRPTESSKIKITYSPLSYDNPKIGSRIILIKDLEKRFKIWLDTILEYDKVTLFGNPDPIIQSNAQRFYQKYKIDDENADVETFDIEQQLFLENYLIQSKEKLKKLKQQLPKEKVVEVEILEAETEEIKSALTKEPKNKIMMRLSRFWGRAQKTGLEIMKEVFINIISEIGKKLLLGE